jgi:hypothetical protein
MRKMLVSAVLAGAALFAPGLISEARASHEWLAIGTAFRVGAAHIAFVFGRPSFSYEPAYFYRYDQPIRYRGHACSRSCFRDAGYYYHHESCPLVAAHFYDHRIDPRWAFDRYAPRYGHRDRYDDRYGYDDRYDDRGSYRDGRHRRYDRDDRYDRHRNRRGRGHRHHDGCGHY